MNIRPPEPPPPAPTAAAGKVFRRIFWRAPKILLINGSIRSPMSLSPTRDSTIIIIITTTDAPTTPSSSSPSPRTTTAATSQIRLEVDLEPDEWIKDSGCSKHITGNRKLFSTYKAYNGGNIVFGSNLRSNIIGRGQICDNKCKVIFSENDSEIVKDSKVIGYSQISKAYIILNKHTMKIKESLNVTFDETPTPSKTLPLVDDDLDEEEAIKVTEKKNLENEIEDETLEID
ncbi:hypothetical protein Tco_0243546 [Tanacetum coccineum]